MNHRAEIRSGSFPGTGCDDGVAACQAVVKTVLADSRLHIGDGGLFQWWNGTLHTGGWLENSIFIYTEARHGQFQRVISMGIRDTTPVTGVYRGRAYDSDNFHPDQNFELTYTSGVTGGQLDFTINSIRQADNLPYTYTWTNVSVDNEGYFDNGITPNRQVLGANKLEGRFYQGGEVGGVYSYRRKRNSYDSTTTTSYGVFGGELVPASP